MIDFMIQYEENDSIWSIFFESLEDRGLAETEFIILDIDNVLVSVIR